MKRVAIAVALSTILSSCGTPGRFVALTPDPAKLDECPAGERAFPRLKPLGSAVLAADVAVTLADGSRSTIRAGTEVVLLDTVLDRDEATAVFVIALRGDKARCASAVLYVKDWSKQVKAH